MSMKTEHEKRIQIDGELFLIIRVYKTPFQSGSITESASLERIQNKEHGGIVYEVKTALHSFDGADSSIHYARAPCARVTQKALKTAFENLLTYESVFLSAAKQRAEKIEIKK